MMALMSDRFANWNQQIIDEFRAHGGEVSSRGFGRSLILLHHIGAKSGTTRIAPVRAIHDDPDTWLIAASKGGAPENPGWCHNLRANPDVVIETPENGTVPVRAEELTGSARDEAWSRFTALSAGFRDYERRTSRVIPVFALHRRRGESGHADG
jgi:deazaflavin-dependent oxidoreductase (nitroreductase family)